MCISELSKVLMCEFHYDYIKIKYEKNLKLLFTDTDSFMHEIKTDDVYEDFSSGKEVFYFSNYSTKSKYSDNSNKLVTGKMKGESGGAAIEYVGLKLKIYSFLVEEYSEHKKANVVNRIINERIRNVVATVSDNEFKDVLLNNKCFRQSINRIQRKDHRLGIYGFNKISMSCCYDKMYAQNDGYDGLL